MVLQEYLIIFLSDVILDGLKCLSRVSVLGKMVINWVINAILCNTFEMLLGSTKGWQSSILFLHEY